MSPQMCLFFTTGMSYILIFLSIVVFTWASFCYNHVITLKQKMSLQLWWVSDIKAERAVCVCVVPDLRGHFYTEKCVFTSI